jgi:Uma2 family endonuclease
VPVATLIHPRLTPAEFIAVMQRTGWKAPMALIDGVVVVVPPTGGDASLAKTELVHCLRAWQEPKGAHAAS